MGTLSMASHAVKLLAAQPFCGHCRAQNGIETSLASHLDQVCPSCFGLFGPALPGIANGIKCSLQPYEDVKMINLRFRFPDSLLFRQRCLGISLQKAFPVASWITDATASVTAAVSTRLSIASSQDSDVTVLVGLEHRETEAEVAHLRSTGGGKPLRRRKRPNELHEDAAGKDYSDISNVRSLRKTMEQADGSQFKPFETLPPVSTLVSLRDVTVERDPLFLGGRYRKCARGIFQTPSKYGDGKPAKTCVSDRIGKVLQEAFKADDHTFTASGREDFDVRCLIPDGRPFYIRLTNPRALDIPLTKLDSLRESASDCDVSFPVLKRVSQDALGTIKCGEETKQKGYRCLVWSEVALSEAVVGRLDREAFDIQQRTPIRVLHRRAALRRVKTVMEMRAQRLSEHLVDLYLRTSAGLYVKEFVHGDHGRTEPSLSSIVGSKVDLLELDVVDISVHDWPPD